MAETSEPRCTSRGGPLGGVIVFISFRSIAAFSGGEAMCSDEFGDAASSDNSLGSCCRRISCDDLSVASRFCPGTTSLRAGASKCVSFRGEKFCHPCGTAAGPSKCEADSRSAGERRGLVMGTVSTMGTSVRRSFAPRRLSGSGSNCVSGMYFIIRKGDSN